MNALPQTGMLLRLMTWMSPAFPVGGFAYSGGLERAVADRLVTDHASLAQWISLSLKKGAGWNDAVLLAEAHRSHGDREALSALAELAAALAGRRERHAETMALGAAFVDAARACRDPVFVRLPVAPAYPVAVGAIAGAHGVALEPVLAGFLHAMASQLVSAGIRLSVIGQSAGLAILAGLEEPIAAVARAAAAAGLDDLGGAMLMGDIESLRHEVQHTRLFRS